MTAITTRDELDQAGCDNPNCTHDHSVLYLSGNCHPRAGSVITYHKATGTIRAHCLKCEKFVIEIPVASSVKH